MYKCESGIYFIYNIVSKKYYIGHSICVKSRLNRHKNALRNNIHENSHLQNAFNEYGLDNFIFDILDNCQEDYLLHMENYWCNLLNVHNRDYGYNIEPISILEGKRLVSEETRKKLGANKGRKFSDETKKKQSDIRKGKPIHSEEFKNELSNRRRNSKASEETKLKMSLAAKKRVKRLGSNLDNYNKKKI